MSKFAKPGLAQPKKRLMAPAAFSRNSTEVLDFVGMVAGADIIETIECRTRRMRRPGAVLSGASAKTAESGAGKSELIDVPWWVQNRNEIYISQKIKHKREMKQKEDYQQEVAEQQRTCREEAAGRERRQSLASTAVAGGVAMPQKIEKVVVIKKMRDKDIRREIADIDRKLESTKKKCTEDNRTLQSAIELIRLKDEELALTRERMIHLYRKASELIVRQSQELGGAEDSELVAFLKQKRNHTSLLNEMITHKEMERAVDIYKKFNRIDELWSKLREFAFMVGKVELRRQRAIKLKGVLLNSQFKSSVTDMLTQLQDGQLPDAQPQSNELSGPPAKLSSGSNAGGQRKQFGATAITPSLKKNYSSAGSSAPRTGSRVGSSSGLGSPRNVPGRKALGTASGPSPLPPTPHPRASADASSEPSASSLSPLYGGGAHAVVPPPPPR